LEEHNFISWKILLVLEVILGGFCDSLKVSHLSERVFSSYVSSKRVGFQILKLRIFVCPKFNAIFIYEAEVDPIGRENSSFGKKNVMRNGP
jgi:hypothetical protein